MKPQNIRNIITAAFALLLAPAAFAQNGTWTNNSTGGSWNTPGNWSGGITADGAGFTADFSTLDIPGNTTVTLDADRTIGNLIFADTNTGTPANWVLAAGTTGNLTISGTTPTITVNTLASGRLASITARLEGTNGFTKAGNGTLVLNYGDTATNISGNVVVSAGVLNLQGKPLAKTTSVAINGGTLISATTQTDVIGGTISFGGGTLQYNNDPATDYSAQFSTDPNQQYRINVVTAAGVDRVATFSSNLASPGGTLTKLSTGKLILAAANTFNGSTTLSAGTLELSHAEALQNSPINTTGSITGNATVGLVLTGVTSPTFGGLTGNKALASLFKSSGNYSLVTNVTLNPGAGASYTYNATIEDGRPALDGGMTLTKSGPGTQTLGVANSHTGGTILSGGTLNYGNANALSSGPISFSGNSTLQAGIATTLANEVSVAADVTGTFDTNGNNTTLSGNITGDGGFSKTGAGTLIISGGDLNNTLAGAINVNAGTLKIEDPTNPTPELRTQSFANMNGAITVASGASFDFSQNFTSHNLDNAITLSGNGTGGLGALNLWRNATANGTINLAADTTISHTFNTASISGSITGTDRNLTLTTLTTPVAQPGMTVSGPISLGTGGITVQGAANSGNFSIRLSDNNSYTGETRVVSGTLMLSGDARINDTSTVRIDSGAVLHLDFEGTDQVGDLFLPGDPNAKADGTYGSFDSLATNKSADFAGTGILQVGGGGGSSYTTWASSNGIPGEPFDGDFNNDGITNGVAYALGLSPTAFSQQAGVLSGTTITFTKGAEAITNADVSWIIETSLTLSGSWLEEVIQAPGNATATISYNLNPVPGTPKKFARLKVVKVP